MKETFMKLVWDSEFFDFNVGKIFGSINNMVDFKNIENIIYENDFLLSYYSVPEELPAFVLENDTLDFCLVDKKTTYVKEINPNLEINSSISFIDNNIPEEKLINLAIQSGKYSRFNVDTKIGKDKFEELYGLLMKNSINHTIAKEVFVFKVDNEIAGFVTLGEKNNRADIGLIAVDNFFRGKGIGKSLMTSAERWFFDLGYNSIQVVTQGDNIPACKLYESCGYTVETLEYFYHIWKKDN
jgi:dTDP-4-amino-4,6-dideoxy-D-galactose acyltransferase